MIFQHVSQVPKMFLIAHDFYPILVFLGEDWRSCIFIVHNVFPHDPLNSQDFCSQCVPIMFPMNPQCVLQLVPQLLKMFPIASHFYLLKGVIL
jgi:hypothetical protein